MYHDILQMAFPQLDANTCTLCILNIELIVSQRFSIYISFSEHLKTCLCLRARVSRLLRCWKLLLGGGVNKSFLIQMRRMLSPGAYCIRVTCDRRNEILDLLIDACSRDKELNYQYQWRIDVLFLHVDATPAHPHKFSQLYTFQKTIIQPLCPYSIQNFQCKIYWQIKFTNLKSPYLHY